MPLRPADGLAGRARADGPRAAAVALAGALAGAIVAVTLGACGGSAPAPAGPCHDGARGEGETDVDCGGPACGPCGARAACLVDADCGNAPCVSGRCGGPYCDDGVDNGAETDVDCGGPLCLRCGDGLGCALDADCLGNLCRAGRCAPSCPDGQVDGNESDLDCGGRDCPGCGLGQACRVDSDCASDWCRAGWCAVRPSLTFAAPLPFDTGLGTRDLRAADFDGDGVPDLAFAAIVDGAAAVGVMLSRFPHGTLQAPVYSALPDAGSRFKLLAASDLAGHGFADAIALSPQAGGLGQVVRLAWQGDRLGPPTLLGGAGSAFAVGLLDGDGRLDLLTAYSGASTIVIRPQLGAGGGLFVNGPTTTWQLAPGIAQLAVGDLDGDGRTDCALGGTDGALLVAAGDGSGRLDPPSVLADGDGKAAPDDLALLDLDGDHLLDYAYSRSDRDEVAVALGGPGLTLRLVRPLRAFAPTRIQLADLDGDGVIDLVTGGKAVISVLGGRSDGRFDGPTKVQAGQAPISIAAADFDTDGRVDLAAAEAGSGRVWLLLNRTP